MADTERILDLGAAKAALTPPATKPPAVGYRPYGAAARLPSLGLRIRPQFPPVALIEPHDAELARLITAAHTATTAAAAAALTWQAGEPNGAAFRALVDN